MVQPETPDDFGTTDPEPAKAPAARWGLVALAAVAVLTLLAGVTALVIGGLGGSSPSAPSGSTRYVSCIQGAAPGGAGTDEGYCDRFAEDVVRRTELTQEQRDRLDADARKAQRAVRLPSSCTNLHRHAPSGRFPECEGLPVRGSAPAGPGDAEAIRLSLERAGFPGAVVRIARADDPAPHGTIVFGVPIADACYVGYVHVPGGGGGHGLQGKLPGGRCLSA
jgi:hypothetical protein